MVGQSVNLQLVFFMQAEYAAGRKIGDAGMNFRLQIHAFPDLTESYPDLSGHSPKIVPQNINDSAHVLR